MTDSQRSKSTVQVPTRLVWAAGGILMLCLIGIAYLVGRESGLTSVDRTEPAPQMADAPGVAAPRSVAPTCG